MKFAIDGIPDAEAAATRNDVLAGSIGVITRLENLQSSLPKLLERTRENHAENQQNLVDADHRIGHPFKHASQLADVQQRADAIAAQLVDVPADAPVSAPTIARPRQGMDPSQTGPWAGGVQQRTLSVRP